MNCPKAVVVDSNDGFVERSTKWSYGPEAVFGLSFREDIRTSLRPGDRPSCVEHVCRVIGATAVGRRR